FGTIDRAAECILDRVLDEREVGNAEASRENRGQASRLMRKGMFSRVHLHVQDLDRANLDGTSDVQNGTALGDLGGLRQVFRLNHDVASDDVLCLRKGTVLDDYPVSADDFARWLQRVTGVLEMALRAELLKPSHPFLHLLLLLFGSGICLPATK